MGNKTAEAPSNSSGGQEKNEEIDRLLSEAYKFMYEMQKVAKDLKEELSEPKERQDKLKQQVFEEMIVKRKGLIQEKMAQLKAFGMTEGELRKLDASLSDPLLTNF